MHCMYQYHAIDLTKPDLWCDLWLGGAKVGCRTYGRDVVGSTSGRVATK